jgi:hypothetical protein
MIPLAMDMAGNARIQSSAVTIEAMASTSGWRDDLTGRFLRELGGSVLNGAAVACFRISVTMEGRDDDTGSHGSVCHRLFGLGFDDLCDDGRHLPYDPTSYFSAERLI